MRGATNARTTRRGDGLVLGLAAALALALGGCVGESDAARQVAEPDADTVGGEGDTASTSASLAPEAPAGDFGDAPDDLPTFYASPRAAAQGEFPTAYDTTHCRVDPLASGAHVEAPRALRLAVLALQLLATLRQALLHEQLHLLA